MKKVMIFPMVKKKIMMIRMRVKVKEKKILMLMLEKKFQNHKQERKKHCKSISPHKFVSWLTFFKALRWGK